MDIPTRGTEKTMNKPPFDPSQPFSPGEKPAFDPSQPFSSGDQSTSTSQPPNATMEAIAAPFRAIGNAVAPYAGQVASSPDIQPFANNSANPFTMPQGG